jgi:hypothetical protein
VRRSESRRTLRRAGLIVSSSSQRQKDDPKAAPFDCCGLTPHELGSNPYQLFLTQPLLVPVVVQLRVMTPVALVTVKVSPLVESAVTE